MHFFIFNNAIYLLSILEDITISAMFVCVKSKCSGAREIDKGLKMFNRVLPQDWKQSG